MRYQGKRVIWESKRKLWQKIFFAALFVAAILFIGPESSPFMFWTGLIFFGGGGLAILVMVLLPGYLFAGPGSALAEKIAEEQFQRMQSDTGFFEYTDTGFIFCYNKKRTYFDWHQILAIFGYQEAAGSIDIICIDIFGEADKGLTLTEEMPGWFVFKDNLRKHFPTIPANWDVGLTTSDHETELTLLYERNGRSQSAATAVYYKGS